VAHGARHRDGEKLKQYHDRFLVEQAVPRTDIVPVSFEHFGAYGEYVDSLLDWLASVRYPRRMDSHGQLVDFNGRQATFKADAFTRLSVALQTGNHTRLNDFVTRARERLPSARTQRELMEARTQEELMEVDG